MGITVGQSLTANIRSELDRETWSEVDLWSRPDFGTGMELGMGMERNLKFWHKH